MYIDRTSFRSVLIILLAVVATYASADKSSETFQSAEMIDFMTGDPVVGGGVLYRSKNEVRARLSMADLDTWASYTVWWIVFNKPSKCSDPCGEDDIFEGAGLNRDQIDRAEISVFYADGFVTGADGVGNVTAHLNAGKLPAGLGVNFGWKGKSGLKKGNGKKAEIHMVVRSHGGSIGGMVGFQTSNFDGECGVCEDQLAILFSPL